MTMNDILYSSYSGKCFPDKFCSVSGKKELKKLNVINVINMLQINKNLTMYFYS